MSLSTEQTNIINANEKNVMILAGPGTGKSFTMLEKIRDLVVNKGVAPETIYVLCFTNANAKDLKNKIRTELNIGKTDTLPQVYTLHGFALRQLMKNSTSIDYLPKDFEIANDFEERQIVFEDLKGLVKMKIDDIKTLFNKMSAARQTLNADRKEREVSFERPDFISQWKEHRDVYGYVMRSELVYQFRKLLTQVDNPIIDGPINYLIVDEYQDLNKCDLNVIDLLAQKGANLLCAGDDDQSIYGFRYAYPEGIQAFIKEFQDAKEYQITECRRCDKKILELANIIIQQDNKRIAKVLNAVSSNTGEVSLLRFANQNDEANKIASLIGELKQNYSMDEKDIIILLRGDFRGAFSTVIKEALQRNGIAINESNSEDIFDTLPGIYLVSLLKYIIKPTNDLALRTIMYCTKGIGDTTIAKIYPFAVKERKRFSLAIDDYLKSEKNTLLSTTISSLGELVKKFTEEEIVIKDFIKYLADTYLVDVKEKDVLLSTINSLIDSNCIENVGGLVLFIDALSQKIESPDVDAPGIRIMTMHKAKGLTAKAVFIVGCEEEFLRPGSDTDEERRLFYVSITRAKHFLFMTHCKDRGGTQQYSGTSGGTGNTKRNLIRFIQDLPIITTVDGNSYDLPKGLQL